MALHIVPISSSVRIAYIGDLVRTEQREPDGYWATERTWNRITDDDACDKALAHARELRDAEPYEYDPSSWDLEHAYTGIR